MSLSPLPAIRRDLGYIGAHASLLLSGIGFLFLQQYVWAVNIARLGYGPYYTTSYLETVSAIVIVVDLIILRWAVKGSKADRNVSLLWPAVFVALTLLVLIVNSA